MNGLFRCSHSIIQMEFGLVYSKDFLLNSGLRTKRIGRITQIYY